MKYRVFLSSFLVFSLTGSYVPASTEEASQPEQQFKMEEMTDACEKASQRDKICDVLVQFRQIGNDALEFAKESLELTQTQYTLLTIGNSLATGRVRFRTSAYLIPDADLTFDLKRDETHLLFEKKF